jgi:hypothetical protein
MQVGDHVVWYSRSKKGRTLSFRKGYGVIRSINEGVATIVTDCKGRVTKPLSELTPKNQDTPLSIFGYASEHLD